MLKINQENERLMEEYEKLSSDVSLLFCFLKQLFLGVSCFFFIPLQLLNWIAQTRQWLENRSNILTLDATRKKLEDYREYRSHLKPPRLDEKGRLETMYNSLQTRLRLSNRPAYLPTEGKLIQASD